MRTTLRLILGLTFLVAGGMKLADPLGFFSGLFNYRVPIPDTLIRVTAASLPWLEVTIGLGFIFNFWAETIRPLTSVLLLIFVLMLGQALIRGLDLNCSCFGSHGDGWFARLDVALVRAIFLFTASLYVAAAPPTATSRG